MKPLDRIQPLLVYTMTSGLGDFIVLGDLIGKIERLIPGARCIIVHRKNPHLWMWQGDDGADRFFNIFSIRSVKRLVNMLSNHRKAGYTVFGLQMAPGSIQGFLLYRLLKKFGLVDYIVDFNLINADIITPPRGNYMLGLHLNQVGDLFQVDIPPAFYRLNLPGRKELQAAPDKDQRLTLGIHPWSRRGHLSSFVWPYEKWLAVFRYVLSTNDCRLIVFGRDKSFNDFKGYILEKLGDEGERVAFCYSNSVHELIDCIDSVDAVLTVNTAVVHIGYALNKTMFILNGPSLDLWVPKGENIHVIRDRKALFQASDKWEEDGNFGSVGRIDVDDVIEILSAKLSRGRNGC